MFHHDVAGGSHLVQFYENDEFLFDIVGTFIGAAISGNEPVVVITTPEHRRGFTDEVIAKGFDPARVIFADARETLATFMSGDMPDEERFMTLVGGMLEQLTGGRTRISAYGEMVDLLWRDGNPEAAIRLEELWNDLATLYPFSLFCAYSMGNFYRESDARLFERVCGTHGRVFPAESYSRSAEDDTRLREIAALQQRATALEAEIEHRRKLELALRQALAVKDEFLATLSHELRTPLTAILGWARMLNVATLDEKTTRLACETIERSARTQAALIDDLLDVSRIVTGKLTMRSEPVDFADIVRNAVGTMQLAADARAIRIRLEAPGQPAIVNGDPTRLQQVAWNLISNAVKFSDPGSEVAVSVDLHGDQARLMVSDTGRGITPDFLPIAFEPFRQADGTSTRHHTGLGLGLAIVKYITELHGGTVVAQSDGLGMGARFTVMVPMA